MRIGSYPNIQFQQPNYSNQRQSFIQQPQNFSHPYHQNSKSYGQPLQMPVIQNQIQIQSPQKIIPRNIPNNYQTKKLIGDYEYQLNDNIGSGFSSTVYLGKNTNSDDQVAIKVINMSKIQTKIQSQLLQSELDVLQRLQSPFIVNVFEVIQTKNNTYIVSEYCNEGDLSSLLLKQGKIEEQTAKRYIYQIVQGLQELFKNNVVHRDLKPSNIMLKDGKCKIVDLGFCLDNDNPSSENSKLYNVGSPNYMSPESLLGNQYSFKSDIWSIGATYFELLYGTIPWQAQSEQQLGELIQKIPVQFQKQKNVSEESKEFIKQCLTVKLDQRLSPEELFNHTLFEELKSEQTEEFYIPQIKIQKLESVTNESFVDQQNQSTKNQKTEEDQILIIQEKNDDYNENNNNNSVQYSNDNKQSTKSQPKKEISQNKSQQYPNSNQYLKAEGSEIVPSEQKKIIQKISNNNNDKNNNNINKNTEKNINDNLINNYFHQTKTVSLANKVNLEHYSQNNSLTQIDNSKLKQQEQNPIINDNETKQNLIINETKQNNIHDNQILKKENNSPKKAEQPTISPIDNSHHNNNNNSQNLKYNSNTNNQTVDKTKNTPNSNKVNSVQEKQNTQNNINNQPNEKLQQQQQQKQQSTVLNTNNKINQSDKNEKIIKTKQQNYSNDQKILSQINYCRFLFRLYKMHQQFPTYLQSPFSYEMLQFMFLKNIYLKISQLEQFAQKQTNIYQLINEEEYFGTQNYQQLKKIISEYYLKYNSEYLSLQKQYQQKIFCDLSFERFFDQKEEEETISFYEYFQIIIKKIIRELNHLLKINLHSIEDETIIPDQYQSKVVLLDYLVTLSQLINMIKNNFQNYTHFSKNSKIEEIADGNPVKLQKSHFYQIRNKIFTLKI